MESLRIAIPKYVIIRVNMDYNPYTFENRDELGLLS